MNHRFVQVFFAVAFAAAAGVAHPQRLAPLDEVEAAGGDTIQVAFTPLYQ